MLQNGEMNETDNFIYYGFYGSADRMQQDR